MDSKSINNLAKIKPVSFFNCTHTKMLEYLLHIAPNHDHFALRRFFELISANVSKIAIKLF